MGESFVRKNLKKVKRIVVKVGTNLLWGPQEGLNLPFMEGLARDITTLRERDLDVILVSSGAVGAGAYLRSLDRPPENISVRQALAAMGQSRLMRHYISVFDKYDVKVAQLLLTRDNLDHRQKYLNARNTLETLLEWKVLPIVNENDTVAVEELKFGDNDNLSALVAIKIRAGLLVLLTDVDGLYDRPPSDPEAHRIPAFHRDDRPEVKITEDSGSRFSLGGMASKLAAARLATRSGILVNIAGGFSSDVLLRILDGEEVGTWFEPGSRTFSARKTWLAFGKHWSGGRIQIDEGAEEALQLAGKSLLASGVVGVEGQFIAGDLVRVCNRQGREIGRGLSRFSSAELLEIKGKRTPEIAAQLGQRSGYEVIHRDDLLVFERGDGDAD